MPRCVTAPITSASLSSPRGPFVNRIAPNKIGEPLTPLGGPSERFVTLRDLQPRVPDLGRRNLVGDPDRHSPVGQGIGFFSALAPILCRKIVMRRHGTPP